MNFLKQNKIIIIGLVVVIIGLLVYFRYFSGESSATLTATSEASTVSKDLLVQLQNLHTIKLDDSIFKDPAFLSLTDFGVQLPSEPVGRRNPFIPLGK